MKKLLLSLIILTGFSLSAQRTCGTEEILRNKIANDPAYAIRHQEMQDYLNNPDNFQRMNNNAASPGVVVTIPVVFHILYKNGTQNITDAQINSQLAILNADFRKLNADFTTVVPSEFQSVAADMEVVFCKASIDPDGNTTTGVTRKSVPQSFVLEDSYYTSSGEPAWDTTKYLNIWIGRFTNQQLLGFALLPTSAGDADDGLCIDYQYVGNIGTATAPYNKGRTATHEIGHYFNLYHPWGLDNTNCGTGNNSDFASDTPSTNGPYFGCPEFPAFDNSCGVNDPNGSMFMNYMDYVDDACMAMFSNSQKTRVQNCLATSRASLLTSNGCGALSLDETQAISAIAVYPNPVSQYFMITSPHTSIDMVEIFNTNGQLVKTQKLTDINNKIYIEEFESGVYYLRIYNEGKFLKSDKMIKK